MHQKQNPVRRWTRTAFFVFMTVALLLQSFAFAPASNSVSAQTSSDTWQFRSETIPDGTCFTPGQSVSKSWTFRNVGSVVWSPQYTLAFSSGDQMGAPSSVQLAASNVGAQNDVTVSVSMTAPATPGTYQGNWSMKDASGNVISSSNAKTTVWVQIVVAATCSATSVVASGTQSAGGPTLATGATPLPKDFDFQQIDAGHIQFWYQGQWIASTPSADGKYSIPETNGTVEFFTVTKCKWAPTWTDWGHQECNPVNTYFRDFGLPPAYTIDANAERQFYSFIKGITFGTVNLGSVGMVTSSGALVGANGYTWVEVGSAESFSMSSFTAALRSASVAGAFVLPVAFMIMGGRVFVPVQSLTIVAIAAPLAPMTTFASMQVYIPAATYSTVTYLESVMGQSFTTAQLAEFDFTWLEAKTFQKAITLAAGVVLTVNATKCSIDLTLDFKGERFSVNQIGDNGGGCDPAAEFFYAIAKLIEKFGKRIAEVVTAKSFIDALARQDPAAMQFKLDAQEVIFNLQGMLGTLLREMVSGGYFR